jgi:glucosylceramidase
MVIYFTLSPLLINSITIVMKSFLIALILMLSTFSITAQQKSFSPGSKKLFVYTTADSSTLRLTPTDTLSFKTIGQPKETQVCVFVDPSKTYQSFMGIGGALTDASAETYAKLPANRQKEFMEACYDPKKGIGYSFARTTIHSCDFSSGSYTYINEGDKELKTFNIDHDRQFRLPFTKKAIEAAGGKLTMFASPWSPPAFMKDNNSLVRGGKLLPEYYQAWANYYVKFINAYAKEGIPLFGLSIQNEPMATQSWESCIYTAEDERDFLKNFLGPTLAKNSLGNKKVIVWDHNRDLMYQRASTLLDDPQAAKYAWGVGFHWYETWTGGTPMFDNVARVKEAYPDKNVLFTEGCNEKFDMARIHDWSLGERYGKSMINDFNSGSVAWTDWNILLDENGGPNHVGNFCFAPIHANTKTGELIYTNSYYYIGHFSKFIRPGAKRVMSSASRSALLSTSFLNQNGQLVTVVMNQSDKPVNYLLWINNQAAEVKSPAHSIATLVLQ